MSSFWIFHEGYGNSCCVWDYIGQSFRGNKRTLLFVLSNLFFTFIHSMRTIRHGASCEFLLDNTLFFSFREIFRWGLHIDWSGSRCCSMIGFWYKLVDVFEVSICFLGNTYSTTFYTWCKTPFCERGSLFHTCSRNDGCRYRSCFGRFDSRRIECWSRSFRNRRNNTVSCNPPNASSKIQFLFVIKWRIQDRVLFPES